MKHRKFITRALALPVCVLVALFFAGPSWALGINFSVKTGAVGAPGTAVNAASDGADIYVGGGGTNVVRIPLAMLGLQPGDEVDAFCVPSPFEPLLDDVWLGGGAFVFSVDDSAVGVFIPAGPPNPVFVEAAATEAAGDIFAAFWWMGPGFNNQVMDESVIGIVGPGAPEDDMDALDIDAAPIFAPGGVLPIGSIAFSLAAGSPSLLNPPGFSESDVLMPDGSGGFTIGYPAAMLNIPPGDDLDALWMDGTFLPVFSVAPGGSGLLLPGDLYVPDGVLFAPDGLPDLVLPAVMFQLLPTDNVNALDGLMLPPEDPGVPEEWDTDGDTLPDYWEEGNGLDPYDDGSTDPDMGADGDPDADGFTNKEEYDNGTDPLDPDSHPVPVTAPWAFAVLAGAIVALARKRLTW